MFIIKSDKIIHTTNEKTIIGVIGIINYWKGQELLQFLLNLFKFSNDVVFVLFGTSEFLIEHSKIYSNIFEFNDLLLEYKPPKPPSTAPAFMEVQSTTTESQTTPAPTGTQIERELKNFVNYLHKQSPNRKIKMGRISIVKIK